ncbi:hypothetical protein LEP1GSC080_0942 [Leptospira interrogans str. FPW2026]|nr:hypothetical protein LEP1GSC080_0942 [Leptospira interrogans str. FPW2026]
MIRKNFLHSIQNSSVIKYNRLFNFIHVHNKNRMNVEIHVQKWNFKHSIIEIYIKCFTGKSAKQIFYAQFNYTIIHFRFYIISFI